jgi:5-methylcytosine-specific restriction protein A
MTIRKRLSPQQRFDLLKRENFRCHLCPVLITPSDAWDISHEIPLELGGADDDTNRRAAHRKCHRDHTARVDIPAIAKAKRVQAKHWAGSRSARPMRGGRHDTLKRKMDGTVVVRATGRPLFFRPTRSAA